LLAPPGEFHPVRLDTPAEPCIEVFSHEAKIGKRFDISKFNTLIISALNALLGLLEALCMEGDVEVFTSPQYALKWL
jgi:hypothetical protein